MTDNDHSNPFEAPSSRPDLCDEASAPSRREISPRLLPAFLCGLMGLGTFGLMIVTGRDLASGDWERMLSHPFFPVLMLIGLSAIAWSVSSYAWIRSEWKVAALWTAVAFVLLLGARGRMESARQYEAAAAAARAAQRP